MNAAGPHSCSEARHLEVRDPHEVILDVEAVTLDAKAIEKDAGVDVTMMRLVADEPHPVRGIGDRAIDRDAAGERTIPAHDADLCAIGGNEVTLARRFPGADVIVRAANHDVLRHVRRGSSNVDRDCIRAIDGADVEQAAAEHDLVARSDLGGQRRGERYRARALCDARVVGVRRGAGADRTVDKAWRR